jgi:preprotein translocase subunit SecB
MSQEPETLKLYPIQATHIGPRELYIRANLPPAESLGIEESDYVLTVGHSAYDEETKVIQIAVRIEAGHSLKSLEKSPQVSDGDPSEEVTPYHLRIELSGHFMVDDSVFPAERIYDWANTNAIFIMYPYLREHVFALTARSGFRPMLLPLVEVPLFRIPQKEPSTSQPIAAEST